MSELGTLSRLLLPPGPGPDSVPAAGWRSLLVSTSASASASAGRSGSAVGTGAAPAEVRGLDPAPRGTGATALLAFAAERELVLARLRRRPPAPYSRAGVVRVRPSVVRPSPVRSARSRLAGGAAVVLAGDGVRPSTLDEVAAQAGMEPDVGTLRPGSGGVVLVRGDSGGRPVLLRVGPVDAMPQASVLALRFLAGSPLVPRLLAEGRTAGCAWTVEQLLPGRRPRRLGAAVLRDAAAFCAALPPGPALPSGGPAATSAQVATAALPWLVGALGEVGGQAVQQVRALPTVAVHGDFWSGNLLVSGSRLSGVVDWDAFRRHGPAGVDLLHLVATAERLRHDRALGAQVLRRPWAGDGFTTVAAPYWRAVGADPSPRELDALGAVWWLDQVASTLARQPTLAADPGWVDSNVVRVLDGLLGRRGRGPS